MIHWGNILLACLLTVAVSHVNGQGIECYDLPPENSATDRHLAAAEDVPDLPYYLDAFTVNNAPDGEYKAYYYRSRYYPEYIKAAGNITNGMPEGEWLLFDDNNLFFAKGMFVNGRKEGRWRAYHARWSYNDTVLTGEFMFLHDKPEGEQRFLNREGRIVKTIQYSNGLKHGTELVYGTTADGAAISIGPTGSAQYKNGSLHGYKVKYSATGDSLQYEQYLDGKRHGRRKTFRTTMHYKNGLPDGEYRYYSHDGRLVQVTELRSGLPYTALNAYDSSGNPLDPGTLKEGNGTLKVYQQDLLKSEFTYKDQLISGSIVHYFTDGKIAEQGVVRSARNKPYNYDEEPGDDLNLFASWQLGFIAGTDYIIFYEDGCPYQVVKTVQNTDSVRVKVFRKNGLLLSEYTLFNGLVAGVRKTYDHSGDPDTEGMYKIIADSNGVKRSVKDGVHLYYERGMKLAAVRYRDDAEWGESHYFDVDGTVKRTRKHMGDGSVINIHEGDTVNITDRYGRKQGRWLEFYPFFDDCELSYVQYFRNDTPYGTWEIFSGTNREIRVWLDDELTRVTGYHSRRGEMYIAYKGYALVAPEMTEKHGEYNYYDEKGRLTKAGKYVFGRMDGEWKYYRKNGRIKKRVVYKDGQLAP
jgi:antitoxin component YwqK of YwqJK toxin-antitoxin module